MVHFLHLVAHRCTSSDMLRLKLKHVRWMENEIHDSYVKCANKERGRGFNIQLFFIVVNFVSE